MYTVPLHADGVATIVQFPFALQQAIEQYAKIVVFRQTGAAPMVSAAF